MAKYTRFITDDQWKLFEPLLPKKKRNQKVDGLQSTIETFWKVSFGYFIQESVGRTFRKKYFATAEVVRESVHFV